MLIAFCVLQSICIAWVWIALVCRWIFYRDMPNISSYPTVDFAFKSHQHTNQSDEIARTKFDVSADNTAIRELLKEGYTAVGHAKKPLSSGQSSEGLFGEFDEGQEEGLLQDQVEMRTMDV